MAAPTHATSTDPHLNPCMNLSGTDSCLPGTWSSPLPLLWEYCPSSPCILRREGKQAWTANALTSLQVSPEGVAPASAQSADGETEAQDHPALRSPSRGPETQIVTSFY